MADQNPMGHGAAVALKLPAADLLASESLRGQLKAVVRCRVAQLLIPAGKLEPFASGKGKGSGQVDGVVGA